MLDKTCVITFSGSPIHANYQTEFHKLYDNKFGKSIAYTYDWLKTTDFYWNNQQVFQYEKYAGYFLWKPYIIQKTLAENPGYSVLYCDSNLRFLHFESFEMVFRALMDVQGAFFVKHDNFINQHWTKWDCFHLMDACYQRYYEGHQVWTPLIGFENSTNRNLLVKEYLHYCRQPQIVTEEPNKYGENLPGFREHRWEQSVLSLLVEKYGYSGVPDSQIMKWVTKEYSEDLMKMKEQVNANPLSKNIRTFQSGVSNKS